MVDVPAGAQHEAGHVSLPVLQAAPARDERPSADRAGGRHGAAPPRPHGVRPGRARRRPLPAVRRLARDAAPKESPRTDYTVAILTVNAGSTSLKLHIVDGETST